MGDGPVHQADALRFVSVDRFAGHKHLAGASVADEAGQEVGGAHVGAADADVDEGEAEAGPLGGDTDVRGQGGAAAAAQGETVDLGHHRLLHVPYREDVVEVEAYDLVGYRRRHGAGGVFQVGAGAERIAGPGDDHYPDPCVGARLAQGRDHLVDGIDVQRVEAGGAGGGYGR